MKNKNNLLKYISLSILTIILFSMGLFCYSMRLRERLSNQVEVTLSEVAYQNKMVVESKISEQRKLVHELAIMLNTEESLINDHTMAVIQQIYEANDYTNIGIVTSQKTVYVKDEGIETLSENYFDEIDTPNSLILLDEDPINKTKSIFISEPVKSLDGEKGCLFFSYHLDDLVNELSIPSFNGSGYTYIIDSNGNQILNSNNESSFSDFYNIYDEMVSVDASNKEVTGILKSEIENKSTGSINFTSGEVKKMYYIPLNINDWYILTVVPIATINNIYNSIMDITFLLSVFIVIILLVLLYSIIISNYRKNKKVYNLTYVDKVTNGYSFNKFSEEFIKNKDSNKNKAIIVLDIDNFKLFNTVLGFKEGDKILKEIYNIINNECLSNGFCCRKSADNYLIFYEYTNTQKLLSFIKNINNKISNYQIPNSEYVLVPSIGIYTFTDSNENLEDMENKAITAWKTIKNDNYKYYGFFNNEVLNELIENKKILDKLIKATTEDKLEIHYQPKFDSNTQKIVGAEALLRWNDNGTPISPGKFIPIAEESGYITMIDDYVMRKVCKDIAFQKSNNLLTVPVSVNVSRKKMEEKNFVNDYVKIINNNKLDVSDIQIEITEGTILADEKSIQKSVDDLKAAGFYILIDDFGTGYSSISSLKNLNLDGIKIDRSFVIDESEKGINILTYVINLAKSLNAETIAEGVETEEQYKTVKDLGCNTIQGYYFSKPINFEDFSNMLSEKK